MIKKDNFKLSIIIPCYNEKNTIELILEKILQSLNDYKIFNYEIIIVDDYSKDGTIKILENLKDKGKIKIYFHIVHTPLVQIFEVQMNQRLQQ